MTYTIKRIRSHFTRCGYAVQLFDSNGECHTRLLQVERSPHFVPDDGPARFYGDDGRSVRAEAVAFARSFGATVREG